MEVKRPAPRSANRLTALSRALCGLLLGLLCTQTACSSKSPCHLRFQIPCRTDPSICIGITQVRDGKKDCPDGSDEDFRQECAEDQFKCKSGTGCIPLDRVRDGISDCSDGSDEECPPGMHRCHCGVPRCISKNLVGDGTRHCMDGSDEGEDNSNFLCPDSREPEDLFAVEKKKRRRREAGEEPSSKRMLQPSASNGMTSVDTMEKTNTLLMSSTEGTHSFDSLVSGKVYLTAVNEPKSVLSSSEPEMLATKRLDAETPRIYRTDGTEVTGTFLPPADDKRTRHFALDVTARTLGALDPQKTAKEVVTVTGTEGTFIENGDHGEVTYPVYTGSYLSGPHSRTTYLFFFGNHPLTSNVEVIVPSKTVAPAEMSMANDGTLRNPIEDELERKSDVGDQARNEPNSEGDHELGEMDAAKVPAYERPTIELTPSRPIAITKYVEPTTHAEVFAYAGTNTIGRVGTIRRDTPSRHVNPSRSRVGRLYKPSAVVGRRVPPSARATLITDQFIFPGHRQISRESFHDPNIDRAYYDVDDLRNGNLSPPRTLNNIDFVKPTKVLASSISDKRITRTVGLYGPIYDAYYDAHATGSSDDTSSHSNRQALTSSETKEENDDGKTITLFGFAQFSTKISGTNYVFMPASAQPRTFTPRVSINKIATGVSTLPNSESSSQPSFKSGQEMFHMKPEFGTSTREFVSQMSMFTSTVKEPVEIQRTMFTSTVMKQASDSRVRIPKVEDETKVAETLPLNLETIYRAESDRSIMPHKGLLLDIEPMVPVEKSPLQLDVSEIVDEPMKTEEPGDVEHPTGLVSSLTGTEVSDGMTTHWTTLIYGTYIDGNYAHIIESTSSIFYTIDKTSSPGEVLPDSTTDQIFPTSQPSTVGGREASNGASGNLLLPSFSSDMNQAVSSSIPTERLSSETAHEILTSGFILPTALNDNTLSSESRGHKPSSVPRKPQFRSSKALDIVTDSSDDINKDTDVFQGLTNPISAEDGERTDKHKETEGEENSHSTTDAENDTKTTSSFSETAGFDETSRSTLPDTEGDDDVVESPEGSNTLPVAVNMKMDTEPINDDQSSDKVILLTGEFILPAVSSYENSDSEMEASPSILTEGFILPKPSLTHKVEDLNPSTTSLQSFSTAEVTSLNIPSILTAGFILPTEMTTSSSTSAHALPSSAALVADEDFSEDENSVDEKKSEVLGRSAGNDDKIILHDNFISPTPTGNPANEEPENVNEKQKDSNKEETITESETEESARTGKVILPEENQDHTSVGTSSQLSPSISFPVTYYTTSTYFTTYLVDGETKVTSRKETLTHVYTDSEDLSKADVTSTAFTAGSQAGHPEKSQRILPQYKTVTYYTTSVLDGKTTVITNELVKSADKQVSPTEIRPSRSYSVLTYPTTYYTTLTYLTTLLRDGTSTVMSRESVISNVINPTPAVNFHKTSTTGTVSHDAPPTTFYTTYTYFTTFHRDGTTSVSTRLHTVSNVLHGSSQVTPSEAQPVLATTTAPTENAASEDERPTTYYTTFTYYTTYLRGSSSVVSSREEIVSSIGVKKKSSSETPVLPTTTDIASTPLKTTFYTTYTYYTTLLVQGTTSVVTRKDTVTNVVHGSMPTSVVSENLTPTPVLKTYFTTYTYFTTFLRHGTPVLSSRESTTSSIATEYVKPPKSTALPDSAVKKFSTYYTTLTSYYTLHNAGTPSISTVYSTLTDIVSVSPTSLAGKLSPASNTIKPSPVVKTYFTTYTYYTTLLNGDNPHVSSREETITNVVTTHDTTATGSGTLYPSTIVYDVTPVISEVKAANTEAPKTFYTTYTYFTTFLISGSPSVSTSYEIVTSYEGMPLSVDGIKRYSSSSAPHTAAAQATDQQKTVSPSTSSVTHYTTYTYLTTLFRDGTSAIDTRTHLVSSVYSGQSPGATTSEETPSVPGPITSPAPVYTEISTLYTTFTYYTTVFSGGQPITKTNLETITNVISKTISPQNFIKATRADLDEAEGEFHERVMHPTSSREHYATRTYITGSVNSNGETEFVTNKVSSLLDPSSEYKSKEDLGTEISSNPESKPTPVLTTFPETCCSYVPHTVYTTHTYYTTRFHGGSPIISTRYETITNVIKSPVSLPTVAPTESTQELYSPPPPSISHELPSKTPEWEENTITAEPEKEDKVSLPGIYKLDSDTTSDIADTKTKETSPTEHSTTSGATEQEENQATGESSRSQTNPMSATTVESEKRSVDELLTSDKPVTVPISEGEPTSAVTENPKDEVSVSTENILPAELNVTSPETDRPESTAELSTEEQTTTTTTTLATTTATRRNIFGRRRNRPVYKPRPVAPRSTTTTASTTARTTTKTPARTSVLFNRRNTTRVLARRPPANRTFPIRRLRRPTFFLTTPNPEDSASRRKRSDGLAEKYEMQYLKRRLLSTGEDREEKFTFGNNNDLISSNTVQRTGSSGSHHPLGLLRSVEAREVHDGTTTIYATEIHGTYVNGAYAQVVQSKVRVYSDKNTPIHKTSSPVSSSPAANLQQASSVAPKRTQKVGLLSSFVRTAVSDGTTTLHTTNIYGTYVGEVYAHVAQTTSSVVAPTRTPPNPYSTGLISSSTRSEVNDGSTTIYTTKIYGTFVNGYYAHIASTQSSVYSPNTNAVVQPTLLPEGFHNHIYTKDSSETPYSTEEVPSSSKSEPSQYFPSRKTGLLSSFVSDFVDSGGTTTQFITNVFGTYIGQQYAHHVQTTSRVVTPALPTSTSRSLGLVSTVVRSVVNDNVATIYRTEVYGTYIGQLYAQIAKTSTEIKHLPPKTSTSIYSTPTQKTGLLSSTVLRSEVIDGKTTVHLNEIYGTYIGGAYAHIARSTSKVIQPASQTKTPEKSEKQEQKTGLISSMVRTEVNAGTTTRHVTEIHGTYVGNYYAHIARKTSTVLPVSPTVPTSTEIPMTKPEGLISSEIRTEVNQGTTTLHTREIYGTSINGYYAHVARSTSNVIKPTNTQPASSTAKVGLVSAITSTEVHNGMLTLHTTEIYGTSINGLYAHIARSTSNVVPVPTSSSHVLETAPTAVAEAPRIDSGLTAQHDAISFNTEINERHLISTKTTSTDVLRPYSLRSDPFEYPETVATSITSPGYRNNDDLDTAKVNQVDSDNSHETYGTAGDILLNTENLGILSPSVSLQDAVENSYEVTPSLSPVIESSETDAMPRSAAGKPSVLLPDAFETSDEHTLTSTEFLTSLQPSTQNIKEFPPKEETTTLPTDDFEDNDDFDDDKNSKFKTPVASKPPLRASSRDRESRTISASKSKSLTTPTRKSTAMKDYDDYDYEENYDDFDDDKLSKHAVSSRYRGTRAGNTRHPKNAVNYRKSSSYKKDYEDDYEDEIYDDELSVSVTPTKQIKPTATKSQTETTTTSSIRIRPFTGRGRPLFGTPARSSSRSSYTIQFRRPTRTRSTFGQRSDSDNNNDFDDDVNEEEDNDGDIEASEAVVTTATPQALPGRRKQFGSSRYQPFGRSAGQPSRSVNLGRNRRLFGRSTVSPTPTRAPKNAKDPDYDENTTEDDDFDDYDDIFEKNDNDGRHRNVRFTRRPSSRRTFGERRSSPHKRGSSRHREEEEIENDDFDTTTPDYRYSRNRNTPRKSQRNRHNRNRSPSLKASFNSVSRDEDDDTQSLQPLNRIRNNNRNRRVSYNPRTRRPSKTSASTPTTTIKPHLTVTSVVTTVKTLPIYHGFRTSYATLTTTALDTSIINPSQYSTVVSDGMTKTLYSSRVGYPDGFENLHTTITEVVITTTSLASVKLVPIKIGFSTRTDTITDVQVLTTLSTVYSTITPDAPTPTAFPQQFQPPFFPQIPPQNPEFALLTSVTTQIVTSTTVVPIILRGRTILSTLTTTSTAQSTVVQTPSIHLPQIPSAAPFIPQPYFAFQPLTTLLTLYVTGEHGELKPVITTVTVPLYQQPVFHTKVARSLQSSATESIPMNTESVAFFLDQRAKLKPSLEVDIATHYDKLLSSGLEEINDMSEASSSRTQPLDSTMLLNKVDNPSHFDVTTITKGPLTEIYEQKATVTSEGKESNQKRNEVENSADYEYGIGSSYNFRKLQQFEEDAPDFRPQRDFTRIRRPPSRIVRPTNVDPNLVPSRPFHRSFDSPNVRIFPTTESFSEPDVGQGHSFRPITRIRGRGVVRRPFTGSEFQSFPGGLPVADSVPEQPGFERPLLYDTRFSVPGSPYPQPPINLPSSGNTQFDPANEFSDPIVLANRDNVGFREIRPPLPRRPAAESLSNSAPTVPLRRLRVTRPLSPGLSPNGLRRVTRTRSFSPESTVSPDTLENELPAVTDIPRARPDSGDNIHRTDVFVRALSSLNELNPYLVSSTSDQDRPARTTVRRRIRPSYVPGDGSGSRRPVLIRRTRTSAILTSATGTPSEIPVITPHSRNELPQPQTLSVPLRENNAEDSLRTPPKKIIRLRRPGGSQTASPGQRRRLVVSRRPVEAPNADATLPQARGPVTSRTEDIENNLLVNSYASGTVDRDLDDFNKIPVLPTEDTSKIHPTRVFPITYYTTLTYFTTFLHGTDLNYASREATFSNVIDQPLNPSLVSVFKSHAGQITPSEGDRIVHLASRTLGDTTTIVNLASRQNVYNSDVYKLLGAEDNLRITATEEPPQLPASTSTTPLPEHLDTSDVKDIADVPKTYITLFTYMYTFYDGAQRRESARSETLTSTVTDPSHLPTEAIGSTVDNRGFVTVGPVSKTVKLGSRDVKGTTTEVNLDLKTLIQFDGLKNVVIASTNPFSYVTPTRTLGEEKTLKPEERPSHSVETSDLDALTLTSLQPSYVPVTEPSVFDPSTNLPTETSPLLPNYFEVSSDILKEAKPVLRVTSVIHKPSGALRSGVFTPRPGVRVRVRPAVSRKLVSGLESPSFEVPLGYSEMMSSDFMSSVLWPSSDFEEITASHTPEEEFVTEVTESGNDNELISDDHEEKSPDEGGISPPRKRLKITVRRPQSESVSRTHTRFVLPSRFEITSRPRFYVVTRTGALGVVSPSQRPFTVKISRKLKPSSAVDALEPIIPSSTTVYYETFTTLTTVPVIFGLETSFRSIIVTTSSPVTVSRPATSLYETPLIRPSHTVVLTYFTTTTYTIPYLDGDKTLYTTIEETNSRIATQTFDGIEPLSYSTVTRPSSDSYSPLLTLPSFEAEVGPEIQPTISIPESYLSPTYVEPARMSPDSSSETSPAMLYETKTFYTTYTLFTTFFSGTDAFISSSEQIVSNIVTVPVTKATDEPSSTPVQEMDGPITVFDTSKLVSTKTILNTVTFYATLFSDTSSFVTPIEEIHTQFETVTETYTITRTILPSSTLPPVMVTPTILPEVSESSVVLTQTLYTTFTNFVTLFQGDDTLVTNIEEVVSNIVTVTVPASAQSSFSLTDSPVSSSSSLPPPPPPLQEVSPTPVLSYTTREILSTQTHYLTLFDGDQHLLSSIEEVVTKYVTEPVMLTTSTVPSYISPFEYLITTSTAELTSSPSPSTTEEPETSTSQISTYEPELVPSIRTLYSTLTFYTTYYSGSSSIIASQEEVLTSYVTLFVPSSLITTSTSSSSSISSLETVAQPTTPDIVPTTTTDPSVFVFTTTDYSTLTLYTTLFSGDETVVISSEHVVPEVITATITPTSTSSATQPTKAESILTFLTTFTYYTTYFSGSEPVIASSESVVTQYITIDTPLTSSSVVSTETTSIETTSDHGKIIGIATVSAGDVSDRYADDLGGAQIIGVSSVVVTETEATAHPETDVIVITNVESHVASTSSAQPVYEKTSTTSQTSKDSISAVYIRPSESTSSQEILLPSVTTETSSAITEGSTVIFFTDVILPSPSSVETPSLPVTSSSIVTEATEIVGKDGLVTSLPPSATITIVTGVDGFVTKFAEQELISSTTDVSSSSSVLSSESTGDIKPGTVIELSDLLGGNTALAGDIGLKIEDIVSLITGKKNKTDSESSTEETTDTTIAEEKESTTTSQSPEPTAGQPVTNPPEEKQPDKDVDYPVFIPPPPKSELPSTSESPAFVPASTKETKDSTTTKTEESKTSEVERKLSMPSHEDTSHSTVSTSVITGARTVFIAPTKPSLSKSTETTKLTKILPEEPTFISEVTLSSTSETTLKPSTGLISTSVVSGVRTVIFASAPKVKATNVAASKTETSTVALKPSTTTSTSEEKAVGRANTETKTPRSFTTLTKNGKVIVSRTTTGATTIFFPAQPPKVSAPAVSTRYITSVESITRTLALTTTRTYYTRDSTLTVPSVYTTTIPPRTFVSTIIGKRTILGILPEPSETVHIHQTSKPTERTTTVTTTTLIFNSIPSTVVRTLVLPTAVSTEGASEPSATQSTTEDSVVSAGTEKPAEPPESADSTSFVDVEPQQNVEEENNADKPPLSKQRDETYLRAANPRLREFQPDMRFDDDFRRPPPPLVVTPPIKPRDDPFLNGRNGVCDPKCLPHKREICTEKDGFWKCRCRKGHARKNEHEICREIQSYVVLLRVMKIGNETINYDDIADPNSVRRKSFSNAAAEAISDAYEYTNVRDHYMGAEVNEILPAASESIVTRHESFEVHQDGVVVNFTVQVSKSVSGKLLEQELKRSLQMTENKIGDSLLIAEPLSQSIQDFDECSNVLYNDCSLRATCENLEGTYTCRCLEEYEDYDSKLPGRSCLEKTENCEFCHGRGDCLENEDGQVMCRCLPMYVGRRCEINGLVLAVALPTAAAVVIILLCVVLCCCRKCRRKNHQSNGGDPSSGMFRGIALKGPVGGTLDRKAMIDTSSESSGEHGRKNPHAFDTYQESGDVTPVKDSKRSDLSLNRSLSTGYTVAPVMIPRAKSQQGHGKQPSNYTVYNGQVYVW